MRIRRQAVNTYFRLQESTVYVEMEVAFAALDDVTSATLLATFTKEFLMAEIPNKAAAGYYQEVGSFIWWAESMHLEGSRR